MKTSHSQFMLMLLAGALATSLRASDGDHDASGASTITANTTVTSSATSGNTTTTPTTPAVAPTISTQPTSLLVTAGGNATFTVVAAGTAPLQYQWQKNGRALEHAIAATLTLSAITAEDAGAYSVVVSNDGGHVTSDTATLSVNVAAGTITAAPQSQTAKAGANVTLSVTTTGTGLTYQWKRNGHPLSGQTSTTLALTNVGVLSAGTYSVDVSNAGNLAATADAVLQVTTDARMTNISTRGHVGLNDEVLITGFVIRGQGSKKVVLRAVGPTLKSQFNVTDALTTPKLTLNGFSGGKALSDSNTAWGGAAALTQAFAQVGAFPLPATSLDAALLETLDAGAYTASISGVNSSTGVALAELYDADTGSPAAEFANISSRAVVGAEAAGTLIAGFAVSGTTSDTLLIRGVGPSLGTLFGMRTALGESQVAIFDAKGNAIATNTVWTHDDVTAERATDDGHDDADKENDVDEAGDRSGAFRLPHGSHDSALLVTLPPGVYTAHVTGVNHTTGVALVEIYEVR
jgi:hypothetical protein